MVHDYTVKSNDGRPVPLKTYAGKTLLIVNTASECGYTPQYEGLQQLYAKYRDRGFEVLAFPSNDFGGQEPGTDPEIAQFCSREFHTTFPLFAKVKVLGDDAEPLFKELQRARAVKWNFYKFLVDPGGQVVAGFGSRDEPMSATVTQAVEKALP